MEVYKSIGVIVDKRIAVLAVSLPKPAEGNAYTITKVYQPDAITDNVIVAHFKDFNGIRLSNLENNFESFVLDLSGLHKIDITKDIEVALLHENAITDSDVTAKVDDIIRNARAGTCQSISFEKDILVPKICGMGTIKP